MKTAPRPMDEDAGAVGLADATRASTMMAIAQRRYGQPDVLEYTAVPRPVVGDEDVLVRVGAASVHPGDYFLMAGEPYLVRLAFGLRRPRHAIPGRDLAGVVAAVGKDVADLQRGDEVFGWSTAGTLAQYACVPAGQLVRTPTNLSMAQAAAAPTSGLTALQALRDVAHLQPGQTVLITGASGGVGTFAVLIAKALRAEVTGVGSTRNMDRVRSLGADHVIDYTRTDFTRTGLRYDAILDNVEAQPLSAVRRALLPTGVLIPNSGRSGLGPPLRRGRPHPREGRRHRLSDGIRRNGARIAPISGSAALAERRLHHRAKERNDEHGTGTLQDLRIPVQAKLAAAWTSFMFLYIYVDYFALLKPGYIDDILVGVVYEFDISQTSLTLFLTLIAIPSLMVMLSTTLPARVNRAANLVVASLYIPVSVYNAMGESWTYFYGLSIGLEVAILARILREAWTWPRTPFVAANVATVNESPQPAHP